MSGMRMGFDLNTILAQKQIIAPRMIQSMEILQLPAMALHEKIQAELQENPFLELKEARGLEGEGPTEFNADAPLKHDETGDLEFARMDEINRDWEDHFNEEHRAGRGALEEMSDKKHEAMMNVESAPISLQDHLLEQLPFLDLEPELFDLAAFIISYLDDNGYLLAHDSETGEPRPIPSEQIATEHGKGVTIADVEAALSVVRRLDPAGVGARDTKECLLAQVDEETPRADLVRAIIQHHLEDVAHNRLPNIQRRTGADVAIIKEALDEIKHLDPKPGARFAVDSAKYVVPDVIVRRTDDGDLDIVLTEDWTPNIRVSRRYVELLKDKNCDKKTREELKRRYHSAHWLIEAIEQRRATLTKVTRAILKHQISFLDQGPEYIQPLKMEQIAEQVGVHVTTVSRAVDEKWVETPRGVFPLKRFFGGGKVNQQTGENVAWEKIRRRMLEFISNEDKSNPLSDEEIKEKFEAEGLDVARRTVTKYREALNIPSSRQRKEWPPGEKGG